MKKKLFLLALPALMALSSCTYMASGTAQPKGNFFKEAADAQQEIFGEQEKALQVRAKAPNRSVEEDMLEPVIGVQYRAKYNISETETPDYRIAVRFVAAIASLDVNATWTRAVYTNTGATDSADTPLVVSKAYTKLNSDGDPITPAAFAGNANYHYFVAYTLYNIPFNAVNDYYIVANLTISDNSGSLPSVSSKAMAARIGGDIAVKFDKTQTGYFMTGTIGGTPDSIRTQDAVTSEGDYARFTVPLSANDSFYIVGNDTLRSRFMVYGYSKIEDGGASTSFTSDDNRIKTTISRRFVLYANSSNMIWTDIVPDLYINDVKTEYSNVRTTGSDKVQCVLNGLSVNDVIKFKTGDEYLDFYYTFDVDKKLGDSYTIIEAGDYTFFVTSSDRVFYNPTINCRVELTFDLSGPQSWPNTNSFRIHAWNDHETLGSWDNENENIVDNSYVLLSKEQITHFQVYFHQGDATKQSSVQNQTFENGHRYKITVNPGSWGGDGNNTFYSGVNVEDKGLI